MLDVEQGCCKVTMARVVSGDLMPSWRAFVLVGSGSTPPSVSLQGPIQKTYEPLGRDSKEDDVQQVIRGSLSIGKRIMGWAMMLHS